MKQGKAEQIVIVSAVTTAGVYAYTSWKDPAKGFADSGKFVTAWGVVYFTLALMATAAPGVAAGFAAVVMISDLLGNMPSLTAAIKASGISTDNKQPAPKPAPHH